MSTATIFQLAGTVAGSAFGPVGAAAGGMIGGLVGNLLFPTTQSAPGLNDLKLQRSQYGNPLCYVWGRFRVAGCVDWIGNGGQLVEHESGGGGKGGGGGQKQKTYTGAWSMKFNKSTRKGQAALASIDKWWTDGRIVTLSDINPTVYIGHAHQLPDSSMEADLGVGRATADRFVGKAVFNDVQMGQFFNRLPNMEALLCTAAPVNGPVVQVAYNEDTDWSAHVSVQSWNTSWNTDQTLPNPVTASADPYRYIEIGVYAHRCTLVGTYVVDDVTTVKLWQDWTPASALVATGGAGAVKTLGAGIDPLGAADFLSDAGVDSGRYCHGCALSADGRTLIALTSSDPDYTHPCDKWHRIVGGTMVAQGTIDLDGAGARLYRDSFGITNRVDIVSDPGSPSVTGGITGASTVENNGEWIWNIKQSAWANAPEYPLPPNPLIIRLLHIDPADSVLKQYIVDPSWQSYGGPQQLGGSASLLSTEDGFCGVVSVAEWSGPSPANTALYTRLGSGGEVTLATILADVFEMRNGLTSSQYDVSQAESTLVHGVAMGSVMQKRNFIDALRQAYFFDVVESDNETSPILRVVMRSRAAPAGGWPVIPDDDLGVHADDERPTALLEIIARTQDSELPTRVNVEYYDPDQDYQIGSQCAQWQAPVVDNVTRVDLPIAMFAGEARAIAKRHLAAALIERNRYAFATSRKWAYLEPTDIVVVRGVTLRLLQKTENPNGVIKWEAVQSAPYIADQTEDGAPADGTTPVPPKGPAGQSDLWLFDVAKARDGDLDVGLYAAAARRGAGASWLGYSLQASTDGGTTWAEIATSTTESVMGTVAVPIGGFTGGNVFDYSNVITVGAVRGAFESVTEDAALNGSNLVIYGNEIIAFTTAEQVDATTWKLSGLLRGRRGTEWAMASHGANDQLALVDTCLNLPTSDGEIGQNRHYKAVTFGTTLAAADTVQWINTAQSARCYAPVHVEGDKLANGDMLLEAVARTRSGGVWRDLVDITQADAPAQFVCEIWDATYSHCARVASGLSAPTYTYTAANQTSDFGAAQSTYYFTFAQVGRFGLGIRARGTAVGGGASVDPPSDPGNPYDPPADPPSGGGAVDVTLSYQTDIKSIAGAKIGNTMVAKFTTTAAPVRGYISVASMAPPAYAVHIILSTSITGSPIVAQAWSTTAANITLGTQFPWSVPLSASTDYYAIVRYERSDGTPSGTPGMVSALGYTLNVETS